MTLPFLPLIGIDIGSSAIKIAELGGSGTSRRLKALGMELLPPEAIADGTIQDVEAVEGAVYSLLNKLRINPLGRRASVAVSATKVEIKRVLVEAGKNDLSDVMNHEAEQHFQTDLAELNFQYQELLGWTEDQTKIPVLMVGAQREPIDQIVDLLRSVGLRTGVVDCEPLCLANLYDFNFPQVNALSAIVDVGANTTQIILAYSGQILYTQSIKNGALEYTRRIMQEMALELDNAEAMKLAMSTGYARTPEPMQAMFAALNDTLVSEVHSALKLYFESSVPIPGVQGLSQVFLSGGGARLLGLEHALGEALQAPVQLLNPFSRMRIPPRQFDLEYLAQQGHIYSVAVGLALRRQRDEKG